MILTPDTVPKLKSYAPGKVYSFYVLSITYRHLLAERMRKRKESAENIQKRLKQCEEWDRLALNSYDKRIFHEFITNEDSDYGRRAALYLNLRILELIK